MSEIKTKRLILRPFRHSDYDDLYEFLSQLKDDEFEGYPDPLPGCGQNARLRIRGEYHDDTKRSDK